MPTVAQLPGKTGVAVRTAGGRQRVVPLTVTPRPAAASRPLGLVRAVPVLRPRAVVWPVPRPTVCTEVGAEGVADRVLATQRLPPGGEAILVAVSGRGIRLRGVTVAVAVGRAPIATPPATPVPRPVLPRAVTSPPLGGVIGVRQSAVAGAALVPPPSRLGLRAPRDAATTGLLSPPSSMVVEMGVTLVEA